MRLAPAARHVAGATSLAPTLGYQTISRLGHLPPLTPATTGRPQGGLFLGRDDGPGSRHMNWDWRVMTALAKARDGAPGTDS